MELPGQLSVQNNMFGHQVSSLPTMLALLAVKTRWGFLADKAFAPFLGKPSRNAGFVFGVVSHSFGTAGRKA
jgi:hypothetical protein